MTRQHLDDPHHLAAAEVVVGVDGSAAADLALDWAGDLAVRRRRTLRIVHGLDLNAVSDVHGRYDTWVQPVVEAARAHGEALVGRCARHVRATVPGLRVVTEVTRESPAELLRRHSASAYLLVLGAGGSGGTIAHLGSVLLAVTSHAEGAVVVVRTDPDAGAALRSDGPVVVGVDGGPVSEAAIATAFEEAAERGAELVAVHVWNDLNFGQFAGDPYVLFPVPEIEVTEQAILSERLAGWQEKYPDVPVTHRIYLSDPAAMLQNWSTTAQLVVVGSRGRGGFRGLLLGSTSNALVQHAHCPVMVVHPAK
jgi:nucleotide-binding universal stress UspA family protein